jgi:hypothetical protein
MRPIYGGVALPVVLLFNLAGDKASAQRNTCNVTVTKRSDADQIFYEIGGDGFARGEQLRIEATNRRTNQGYLFFVAPASTEFSGVLIGKDPDGFFYRVAAGVWKVVVRSDTCTAKQTFSVSGVPNGTWGGDSVALVTSDDRAVFLAHCIEATFDGPIAPNATGAFAASGTYRVEGPGLDRGIRLSVSFSGRVEGENITLEIRLSETGELLRSEVLTLGRQTRIRGCT